MPSSYPTRIENSFTRWSRSNLGSFTRARTQYSLNERLNACSEVRGGNLSMFSSVEDDKVGIAKARIHTFQSRHLLSLFDTHDLKKSSSHFAMATTEATTSTNDQQTSSASTLLIAPPSSGDVNARQVPLGSSESVKLDNLGPLVVNSDGTLSRIANWENMTEQERERTTRVLAVRNRTRLAKQAEQIQ